MSHRVLITGASRGIGAATARLFAQEGWDVALNYNQSRAEAEALAAELGCGVVDSAADAVWAAEHIFLGVKPNGMRALLEELGFVNDAAAYTGWLYDRANVAALEPDVIFADVSISVDEVKKSVIYAPVAAVKNNKVMNVDFAVFERQSPRMFEALREMGKFAAA